MVARGVIRQRDVRMAVDEPGNDKVAGAIDTVIAIEAGSHTDDAATLDGHVSDVGLAGTDIQNGATAQQSSRHVQQHRTRGGDRHPPESLRRAAVGRPAQGSRYACQMTSPSPGWAAPTAS